MANSHKQVIVKKGFQILVSQDQVEAHIRLVGSSEDQQSVNAENILDGLKDTGIVNGVLTEKIHEIFEKKKELDDKHILVAKSKAVVKGTDATIEYKFDTKLKKAPKADDKGNLDYKELNFIQNAVAGQILAIKIPATEGKSGMSIFGEELPAPRGLEVRLVKGQHTEISEDELTLTASADGAIVFKNGNVSVLPNQKISGSVDSSVGNIVSIGSIKVVKDICTDFKVITEGDLEVGGNVEDAIVEANGNVVIKGGFYGDGKGHVKAGGDVSIKFAENQNIEAGKSVYIKGEVLNCNISAGECVFVTGKAASIVGGVVKAKYLITADNLGNGAGVPTHVHVSGDGDIIKKLVEIKETVERLQEDMERVKVAMVTMLKLEMNGQLPPEKKDALEQFKEFKKILPGQLEELAKEKEELENKRKDIADARIVIKHDVHSGSIIHFDPVYREVMNDIVDGVVFSCGDAIIGMENYSDKTQTELNHIIKRIEENSAKMKEREESKEVEQSSCKPEKASVA